MYEFIRIQYAMGRITKEQVLGFVGTYLTELQANEIIGVTNT